ncbi:MAG: nitronate monooxygenase [Bacteroidales bacterium]|nr:nitronate monooxygenase [Bacteroidales bacterium]
MKTRITELFNIEHPVVAGGMIWCSGWRLAAAVSEGGGLGLIGSGSMEPEILREHIVKCRQATDKPFGVNLPIFSRHSEAFVEIILAERVKIVFTSGGNPERFTKLLKKRGIIVAHVVANRKGALKCVEVGVDAVVAEGFEAGGHNGREETTTMALVPDIRNRIDIPLVAAGGIATGRGMLAAMALGAEGVQIGTRFAASEEASCSEAIKKTIIFSKDGDTDFVLKKLSPVRLWKNEFYQRVKEYETRNASEEELLDLVGFGRTKKGIFEGDLIEGEIEFGQIASVIKDVKPAAEIIKEIVAEYEQMKQKLP